MDSRTIWTWTPGPLIEIIGENRGLWSHTPDDQGITNDGPSCFGAAEPVTEELSKPLGTRPVVSGTTLQDLGCSDEFVANNEFNCVDMRIAQRR